MTSLAKTLPPGLSMRRTTARDVVVVTRIAELAGEAVATDRAGRLLAGNDLTAGDDHADLVGGLDRKRFLRVQVREIRPVIDTDVGLVVAVRARDLHQPLLDFGATLERGDETGIERHLREIAAGALERGHAVVGIALQALGLELAGAGDIVLVGAPERREPGQALLALGGRHVVAAEHLGRGLVFADTEDVPVDRELVDRVLDEEAIVREAVDEGHALWIEIDLVGVRGDVILALFVEIREGDDGLAALAERIDGGSHLGELGDA